MRERSADSGPEVGIGRRDLLRLALGGAAAGAAAALGVGPLAAWAGAGEGGGGRKEEGQAMEPKTEGAGTIEVYSVAAGGVISTERVVKSEDEWRRELSPEQFRILRKQGTERAFSGELWDNHEDGLYRCAACGNDLFLSDTKFESGTGWPSFWQPVSDANVATEEDNSFFMRRTEVVCARCGAHLGHVFTDGPKPTGLRYCMNSAALAFVPTDEIERRAGANP